MEPSGDAVKNAALKWFYARLAAPIGAPLVTPACGSARLVEIPGSDLTARPGPIHGLAPSARHVSRRTTPEFER